MRILLRMTVMFSLVLGMTQAWGQAADLSAIHPLDRNPPQFPNGVLVPESVSSPQNGVCWGDPSQDGRVITGEFGEMRGHKSSPHAGVDLRARQWSPIYAVADGCVSFGNPTPKQLIGVKQRINDKFPNSSVWYLHMSRVRPKFANDGRATLCLPVRTGELLGFSGNSYGTGGKEVDSGTAHLHLSYFVSGLMLNPTPYIGAPPEIPPEFNTVRTISGIAADVGNVNTGDASGTRGAKLGFGVPRMCNVYVVKGTGKQTIPYDDNFGTGNYSANAVAPSQAQLQSGQQIVRPSLGIRPDGTSNNLIENPTQWTGGMPEEPDWESYSQMSFEQVLSSEISRRNSDSRWTENVTSQSERGLMVERLLIKSLRLKVQHETMLSRQRQEAMLASLLAVRARRLGHEMHLIKPGNQQPVIR